MPVNPPKTGWNLKRGGSWNCWVKAWILIPMRGVMKHPVPARNPSNKSELKELCILEEGFLSPSANGHRSRGGRGVGRTDGGDGGNWWENWSAMLKWFSNVALNCLLQGGLIKTVPLCVFPPDVLTLSWNSGLSIVGAHEGLASKQNL